MKYSYLYIILIILVFFSFNSFAESNRKERRMIREGNSLYEESKFIEAQKAYEKALEFNNESAEARYNLALSEIRQVTSLEDTTAVTRKLIDNARQNFSEVAKMVDSKPGLAAKANYNLGNMEFKAKDFQKAIDYYKQALRIDPNDNNARKNLRIAQKNLQKNNEDQNKQNQEKENQKDKQEQKQDQDQKQDEQNKQNQSQQNNDSNLNKEQENNLSQQTASQILQAVDNKESATRAKFNKANKGEKSRGTVGNNRKW